MPAIITFAVIALIQIGILVSAVLPADSQPDTLGGPPGVFIPTGSGPQYAIGGMGDGCAEWSSDVLTSSGSACGSGSGGGLATTSIDTESELEGILTDVGDVYTDNDGTLYASSSVAYYVANALQLGQLSDVSTTSLAVFDLLYWTGSQWARTATSSWDTDTTYSAGGTLLNLAGTTFSLNEGTLTDGKICTYESGVGIECDYTDVAGSGDGLSTSTNMVDAYVVYGTGPSTVGAESAFTYDDATNLLTVSNASTTYVSATRFYGALTGTASLASALAANGANCAVGQAPLGVDASGAVESCFDVWTESENTSAGYISDITGEAFVDLSDTPANYTGAAGKWLAVNAAGNAVEFVATSSLALTESQIVDLSHYTDADVSTYLTGGTGITESSGTLSFDCSEVEGVGINCATEAITLDATGNWTGELDGYDGSEFAVLAENETVTGQYTFSAGTTTVARLDVTTAFDFLGEYITNAVSWVRAKIDDYLSGGEGIGYSSGAITFDCSEVTDAAGADAIGCSGENIVADAFLEDIADLTDPGADRILFWDDGSPNELAWLTVGTGLTLTGTTLTASGGGGGGDPGWATTTDGSTQILYPLSYTDDVIFGSNATATAGFWFDYSATTTSVGNGGAGDSLIEFAIDSVSKWFIGADDDDGDSFKVATSSALTSGVVLEINQSTGAATSTGPTHVFTNGTNGLRITPGATTTLTFF